MSQFKRSSIPPLQTITDEQLQELLAREDARNAMKVVYPKLIDVLIAWMPEITDTQIALHTNAVYQGFFGEGVDADERVIQCMRVNGYTESEIAYAIEQGESAFNWLTLPQLQAIGNCFERLTEHYPAYPPSSYGVMLGIAFRMSQTARKVCVARYGEKTAEEIPIIRLVGNEIEMKKLNKAKRIPYKPTLM